MLEKVPAVVGRALRNLRPGMEKIASEGEGISQAPELITVISSDFSEGHLFAPQFTADGAGLSPSLMWQGVPQSAAAIVLLVEDPDAPSREPFVHAIVLDLETSAGQRVTTGELSDGKGHVFGKNSGMKAAWMPPSPPRGHGVHRYVFQVFALDYKPMFADVIGRGALLDAIRGHVIARGSLIGTYERR